LLTQNYHTETKVFFPNVFISVKSSFFEHASLLCFSIQTEITEPTFSLKMSTFFEEVIVMPRIKKGFIRRFKEQKKTLENNHYKNVVSSKPKILG
jgi:hypothetical protein